MSEPYSHHQENWLNGHVTRLINKAYDDFKFLFPDEEPFWQIRCLRQRRQRKEIDTENWREKREINRLSKGNIFSKPELLPIKNHGRNHQFYKKITTTTVNDKAKSSNRSHEPMIKKETVLIPIPEPPEIKEELFLKCPFSSGCYSVDMVLKEPSEISLIKVGSNKIETDTFDLWSKENKSALVVFKEGDSFDIPWNGSYSENIAKIIEDYKCSEKDKIVKVCKLAQDLVLENKKMKERVIEMKREIEALNLKVKKEVQGVEFQYRAIVDAWHDYHKAKEPVKSNDSSEAYSISNNEDINELVKKVFGRKKPIDIIHSYISIQTKLGKCKIELEGKLKKISTMNYKTILREKGFLCALQTGFEEIWDKVSAEIDSDDEYFED